MVGNIASAHNFEVILHISIEMGRNKTEIFPISLAKLNDFHVVNINFLPSFLCPDLGPFVCIMYFKKLPPEVIIVDPTAI